MDNGVRVYDSFFATVEEDEDATKAHFEQSAVKWDSGDNIGVFSNTQTTALTFTRNSSGIFTNDNGIGGSTFYAFYPSSASCNGSARTVTFSSPDPAFDKKSINMPMVATGSSNSLSFKQTCGVLHFHIMGSGNYTKVTLKGNNNESIYGSGTVSLTDATPVFQLSGLTKYIEGTVPTSGINWKTGADIYFVLPTMTLSKGFTLTVLTSDNKELSKQTAKSVTISRGKMIRYELSLDDLANVSEHEYVDLGLSVKWATTNVGASKPEESGDYFAWGETAPKSNYSWSTYKWCNGGYNSLTNYNINSSFGTVDNKTVLDYSEDAASVNWGALWRMPTKAEQDELINECTWTWTTQNGVNGYRVTSNKSGYKDKSIFLPAAGYRDGTSLYDVGSWGIYWSSSLYTDSPSDAFCIYYNTNYVYWLTNDSRCNGHSVRPVYDELKYEHEYVDLGLPSGIKWATTNVGASKPEDYGDYFAWGETEPKTSYSIDNYKYSDSEFNHVTKYCPANQSDFWIGQGSPDGKTVLDPEDDAARANWGGIWRMPTKAEQDELISYCIWDWTTQGGKNGYRVTGPNDNCIFLPAAGYCNYLGLNNAGSNGFYWCSSLTTDYVPLLAWYLDFNSSNYFAISSYRLFGFTVRPVRE